ncbi:MAG: hypothetical protein ACQR33_04625 [Candidatus Saccharibacteria bacterium]
MKKIPKKEQLKRQKRTQKRADYTKARDLKKKAAVRAEQDAKAAD